MTAPSVEVYSFAPVVPAGTAITAGWSSPLAMPARQVQRVDIRVPPGPRGNVGFYLGCAGTPIVPTNTGAYLVTDDEKLTFDLADQITSGAWAFYGYNLGVRSHTVYVRFHVVLPYGPGATTAAPFLSGASLSSGI